MSSNPRTALIVDDEASVRGFVAGCLRLRDIETLQASDGVSALALARGHDGPIHILVSDVHMPGMPGTELAGILSSERPEMKTLIISGEVSPRFERAFPTSWRFLRKPFPPVALLEAVESLLSR
jgi:two-component system, cell cycle sensor histidine kinase and response regulator CckA